MATICKQNSYLYRCNSLQLRVLHRKKRGFVEGNFRLRRPPTSRSGDAPKLSVSAIPSYITKTLETNPHAWRFFEQLAPSYRRAYVGWIHSAKRVETRKKRLREAVSRLAAGEKLGLK